MIRNIWDIGNKVSRKILYPIMIVLSIALWLLTTESGLKSAFNIATLFTRQTITIAEIHGTLLNEIQIKGLQIATPEYSIKAAFVTVQPHIHQLFNRILKIADFSLVDGVITFPTLPKASLTITRIHGALELSSCFDPLVVHLQNIEGFLGQEPITGQGGFSIISQQLKLQNTRLSIGQNIVQLDHSETIPNQIDWRLTLEPSTDSQVGVQGFIKADPTFKKWQGQITNSTVRSNTSGTWQQQAPSKIEFSVLEFLMEPLILKQGNNQATILVNWNALNGLTSTIDIPNVPIQHSNLQAKASFLFKITQKAQQPIEGTGLLTLHPGFAEFSTGGRAIKFSYQGGQAEFIIKDKVLKGQFAFTENKQNTMHGRINLSPFTLTRAVLEQPLQGNITALFNDLSLLSTLIPKISKLKASITAEGNIQGSLKSPKFTFHANTKNATFFIPKQRVTVHNLTLSLMGEVPGSIQWTGNGFLGKGQFKLSGTSEFFGDPKTILSIQGQDLQIYNTANMHIIADPQLTINFVNHTLFVQGTVHIPNACIEERNDMKHVILSKDVVLTDIQDNAHTAPTSAFRIVPSLYLLLGNNVRFKGYGLDGFISGKLEIDERPDGLLAGTGNLTIHEGKYRLQGSTRYVHRGRLLFPPGTLLNDPMLDILISQKRLGEFQAESAEALYVQGTLKKPVVDLYTDTRSQNTEILSRLKSTSPGTGGNAKHSQLFTNPALLLAGSANPFLDRLQTNLGIEEFSFESREGAQKKISTQGGTDTILVVGKSLSSKFYLQYLQSMVKRVTTIRLKYFLSPCITASIETGTEEDMGGDLTFSMERD